MSWTPGSGPTPGADTFEGSDASETASGGSGNDTLRGGGGDDELSGGFGDDLLEGGEGSDGLYGDGGHDTILAGGGDTADGGSGDDVVTVQGEAPAASLLGGDGQDTIRLLSPVLTDFSAANEFEKYESDGGWISGSAQMNTLDLSALTGPTPLRMRGLAGGDVLTGAALGDELWGDEGDDQLNGWTGDDILNGGAENDTLIGGSGSDTASFADKTAAVSVTLNGGATVTAFVGGRAEDTLSGVENVIGGSGADTLNGDAGANRLEGGVGDDLLGGGAGVDTLIGGAGVDAASYRLRTTSVVVVLNGEAPASVTVGGVAEDTLVGIESVHGGSAADTLTGDAGANLFRGWLGRDVLDGGGGVDTVDYSDRTGAVALVLTGASASTAFVGGVAEDSVRNFENAIGGSGADRLTGDAGANRLEGRAGDDVLRGGQGADVLDGGSGVDAADYRDRVWSVALRLNGSGDAFASVGGRREDTVRNIENVYGGAGRDTLIGDSGANLLHGGGGDDLLRGWLGKDVLQGGAGVDVADYSDRTGPVRLALNGAGDATASVNGVAEDTVREVESIYGGAGADILTGDGLANTLRGGLGADVLTGGGGADTFLYTTLRQSTASATGRDAILDFSHDGGDRINLAGIDAVSGGSNEAFTFAPLENGAPGRLDVIFDSDGRWLVRGDVTGDGVPDFTISVLAPVALVEGDFVL